MFKKKWILLLPIISLTSCGFSLGYLVEGNKYNSPIFKENFYRHWDDELAKAKEKEINPTILSSDQYITHYSDLLKYDLDASLNYKDADSYGKVYKMNKVNDMFNYGYQSKLFDGQVQCLGYYQLARVQIDYKGFSMRFDKESDELDYVALQFRATTDNTVKCYKVNSDEYATKDSDMFHNSVVDLCSTFYVKNDKNEIEAHSYITKINFDNNSTNNGATSNYVFLAFKVPSLTRVVGVSYTYTYDDELINYNKEKGIDIDYSLMLYELFMPHTNWR